MRLDQTTNTPRLVPTPPQSNRRYDSSERLPAVGKILVRTLDEITHIHEVRNTHDITFDRLWNRVRLRLKKRGNATRFRQWKLKEVATRNKEKQADLSPQQEAFAKSWARPELVISTPGGTYYRAPSKDPSSDAPITPTRLQPAWKTSVSDILEIAIAYWIEASNAHQAHSSDRAMFCLMEMSYYLGMANAPMTASELKSSYGKRGGASVRKQVEQAALETVHSWKPSKPTRMIDLVCGEVAEAMLANPSYEAALKKFARRIETETGDSFSDLLHGILMDWSSDPINHPDLHREFKRIEGAITKPSDTASR